MSVEQHYSIDEVAKLLSVSRRTVWNYIAQGASTRGKSGLFPVVKLSHKVVRVPARAVNKLLKVSTVAAGEPESQEIPK